ncbi:hypothetical protein J3459_008491 [Metarhizium acridum]|nr:hypothetical protein J3459_008491 [Metarhizium acridum]
MGEGWSDFMAVAVLAKANDTRARDFTVGTWINNSPRGIRSRPYSTNIKTNPYTYGRRQREERGPRHGEIWANTLYEVFWNLVDEHGITADKYPAFDDKGVPTDGRFLAMKLVIGGLAIQPCKPNMVSSARDAILDADKRLTGAANRCLLWKGFAKRGHRRKGQVQRWSQTASRTSPSRPVAKKRTSCPESAAPGVAEGNVVGEQGSISVCECERIYCAALGEARGFGVRLRGRRPREFEQMKRPVRLTRIMDSVYFPHPQRFPNFFHFAMGLATLVRTD